VRLDGKRGDVTWFSALNDVIRIRFRYGRHEVSLTPEAYEEKRWRGLNNLRSALSKSKLDDHHYGYSSGHYNKFASLSDLLEITLLVLDKIDEIPYEGGRETVAEMMRLSDEVKCAAEHLSGLSNHLKDRAEKWAECSWRALDRD
jgi:hypothetical protein